jgi:hypothetical protein
MPKETSGEGIVAVDSGDARLTALALMGQALVHIDGDDTIPAIVGAHLQTAIDSLARHCPTPWTRANLH